MALTTERALYLARGWRDDLPAPTASPMALGYLTVDPLGGPDIHGDSEGCAVWQNLWMYRHTGDPVFLERARAWANYDATIFLTAPGALPGDRGFGFCHISGWGLPWLAEITGDATHLDAAERIADVVATHWATLQPGTWPPGLNPRATARALLLFTALARSPRGGRWQPIADRQADFFRIGFHPAGFYPADGTWTASVFGEAARGRPACSLQQLAIVSWALDEYVALSGDAQLAVINAEISLFVRDLCRAFPSRLGAPHVILSPLSVDEVNGFPGHPDYAVVKVNMLLRGGYVDEAWRCWEVGSGGQPGRMLGSQVMTQEPHYFSPNHGGDIDYAHLLVGAVGPAPPVPPAPPPPSEVTMKATNLGIIQGDIQPGTATDALPIGPLRPNWRIRLSELTLIPMDIEVRGARGIWRSPPTPPTWGIRVTPVDPTMWDLQGCVFEGVNDFTVTTLGVTVRADGGTTTPPVPPPPPAPPGSLTPHQALAQANAYTDAQIAALKIVRGSS